MPQPQHCKLDIAVDSAQQIEQRVQLSITSDALRCMPARQNVIQC
jgi:hypothetical protein